MPTAECFAQVPPFPNDVRTVELRRLQLGMLLADDESGSKALFEACAGLGFFLLDLRGCDDGDSLLRETEAGFEISREFYASGDDEKSRFPLLRGNLG